MYIPFSSTETELFSIFNKTYIHTTTMYIEPCAKYLLSDVRTYAQFHLNPIKFSYFIIHTQNLHISFQSMQVYADILKKNIL